MRTVIRCMLPIACMGVLASPAIAQQEPDSSEVADQPFVEGGVYDKPYISTGLGRTAIGGYAEAHARFAQTDGIREEAGFLLKRWNIFTFTQLNDFVRIGAELEFEDLAEEITLEFAAIDIAVHPSLTVRAGAILSPLGRFNLSHDSPRNEFTDRPLVSTDIIGTALTEPGFGALGRFRLPGAGRLTYELYAVNGFHDGLIEASPDGTRIPAGKKNFDDNNGSPAFVGRLAWSPGIGYELGISAHRGAYNEFMADGEQVAERQDLSISAVDMEATLAAVVFSGEAVAARVEIPSGLHGIYASRQRGLYLQAVHDFAHGRVHTMPGSYFQIGMRYDVVDYDAGLEGDSRQGATLGFNFRPSADTAVKLNYVRGRSRDRFNNLSEYAGVQLSIATYF